MNLFKQHFFHRIHTSLTPKHKSVLFGISSRSIATYGGAIVFGLYPVIITQLTGSETTAGIFISVLTFLQLLTLDMLAGPLMDKKGVKYSAKLALILAIICGIPFLFVQSVLTATILFIGLAIRSSFFVIDPLILQNTDEKDGGFWFGVKEEIISLGDFLGALSVPIFILNGQWFWIGVVWVAAQAISLLLLTQVKAKPIIQKANKKFSFFQTLKAGLHFIQVNHKYPLFSVGSILFEGIFYGAIWFIFPLYLADQAISGGSLSLGIYEVITLLIAIACGFIADRINWKILEESAWGLMIIMVWILPFWHSMSALILVGAFIGIAANFFIAAANHALAKHDEDHEEDGQFASCSRIIMNIGYALSPLAVGYLYQYFGFQASLIFIACAVTLIGIWMISLSLQMKE